MDIKLLKNRRNWIRFHVKMKTNKHEFPDQMSVYLTTRLTHWQQMLLRIVCERSQFLLPMRLKPENVHVSNSFPWLEPTTIIRSSFFVVVNHTTCVSLSRLNIGPDTWTRGDRSHIRLNVGNHIGKYDRWMSMLTGNWMVHGTVLLL